MSVGVGSDDGFVSLDQHSGVLGDEFGDREKFFCFDCAGAVVVVAADVKGHDDFFERGVACALSDTVDGDFDLAGTAHDSAEGVGGCHSQIVVAVTAESGFIAVGDVGDDVGEEVSVFLGGGVTGGIGDIDDGGPGGDDGFDDLVDVFFICAARIFHEVFDIVGELACEFDGVDSGFECLFAGHSEFVLEVIFADAESGVDATSFGRFECFGGDFDIFLSCARESADGDPFEFFGEGFYRFKVAG